MQEEKRKFNRWYLCKGKTATISCSEFKEKEAKIIDIGAGGMKISFPQRIEPGTPIEGKFEILPELNTFSIEGKVQRAEESPEGWEIAIKFDRVTF